MLADMTHVLLQAVDLPYELRLEEKLYYDRILNNQQYQAESISEKERLFADLEIIRLYQN